MNSVCPNATNQWLPTWLVLWPTRCPCNPLTGPQLSHSNAWVNISFPVLSSDTWRPQDVNGADLKALQRTFIVPGYQSMLQRIFRCCFPPTITSKRSYVLVNLQSCLKFSWKLWFLWIKDVSREITYRHIAAPPVMVISFLVASSQLY